jgi:MHS family alpha-ketoglutarate permease-like MFS transporter
MLEEPARLDPGEHPAQRTAGRARVMVAATAGIFVEAFDWTMYGLVAPYLAIQMFPGSSTFAKVIGGYAVFAAGFLARPLGSALMGRITDTRGRRAGLTLSVALMALGALIVAVTPTYAVLGPAAPAIVLLARLLQGVAMGGEIATAATYVVEVAPLRRRHTYGAVAYSGDALGSVGAAAVVAIVIAVGGRSGAEQGGWRFAFVVGALLGLVGWWIRRGVPESPVFQRAVADQEPDDATTQGTHPDRTQRARIGTADLLRRHLGRMVLVFGMTLGSTIGLYFATVYLPEFATDAWHVPSDVATGQLPIALLALLVAMIASGVLADRFGPLALIRTGFTLMALTTAPLMFGMVHGTVPYVVAASALCLGLGLQLGVTPIAGARLFPVPIRAVALGVPAAIAIAGFGGTLPLVGAWLTHADRAGTVIGYVTVAAAVSAVGSWLLRESLLLDDAA